MMLSDEDKLLGLIAVSDRIRKNAVKVLKDLKNLKIRTVMLTGDNKHTAKAIAM
jgi:P-type E1-E2 ATPase